MEEQSAFRIPHSAIGERLRKIVAEQLMIDDVRDIRDLDTLEELGMDSFDRVEIQLDIEDEFDIEIGDYALDDVVTFVDLVQYVTDRIGGQKSELRSQIP
jgi:acyl carrier protein